jgi:hypothetical protein
VAAEFQDLPLKISTSKVEPLKFTLELGYYIMWRRRLLLRSGLDAAQVKGSRNPTLNEFRRAKNVVASSDDVQYWWPDLADLAICATNRYSSLSLHDRKTSA